MNKDWLIIFIFAAVYAGFTGYQFLREARITDNLKKEGVQVNAVVTGFEFDTPDILPVNFVCRFQYKGAEKTKTTAAGYVEDFQQYLDTILPAIYSERYDELRIILDAKDSTKYLPL